MVCSSVVLVSLRSWPCEQMVCRGAFQFRRLIATRNEVCLDSWINTRDGRKWLQRKLCLVSLCSSGCVLRKRVRVEIFSSDGLVFGALSGLSGVGFDAGFEH